jgi:hypothetical protein
MSDASAATPGHDSCGCPETDGKTYHQRGTCTDPAVAALDWYADRPAQQAATPGQAATLQELVAAYRTGAVTGPLMLDNDSTSVYQGDDEVFEMHPDELIEQALTMLGIPWEHV